MDSDNIYCIVLRYSYYDMRYDKADIAKVCEMYANGATYIEISRSLKMPQSTSFHLINKHYKETKCVTPVHVLKQSKLNDSENQG